ncbi:fructosamine kinase family protein [Thalassobacillus pellis]|uniref:fructosamine kinase family protein n=1 Tax=Thalassobacillus pellis TaxID=748008 RepID=UPI001961ACAD|nr:fructosamine kinase family protein [Thalassobacillus pellis]MBM7551840.1 fructosamine-3-kinase [Thalassobacillus pellis]
MNDIIKQSLKEMGDSTTVAEIRPVTGGDINEAFFVRTEHQAYFVKTNDNVPSDFFRVEAEGLRVIQASNSIAVPGVYHYDEPKNGSPGTLILEWIEGKSKSDTVEQLGHGVAHMHLTQANQYGFGQSTFIGTLTQENGWHEDWLRYYRDKRLLPQLELAIERGRMNDIRHSRMTKLLNRLDKWIDPFPASSLLHGDLWGGNWMAGPGGKPYLIDPSVCYGDHCFELAFTELFGGFPPAFYESYKEVYPLPDSYEDTKALYQLFYLMVHLNFFGESYGRPVDRILDHYVG